MLNILWPIFIIISYIYACFSGNIANINIGIFDSCKSAVELTITFLGTITLWSGIMQIAKDSSLSKKLTIILKPFIKFLFPEINEKDKVHEEISLNIIANILGLGNAATPLGLKAMKSLSKKTSSSNTLSNPMAMLILLNTASLQIIPTTVIALRTSLCSTDPTKIIFPVWVSTICAAIAGVISVKFFIKIGK